MPAPYPFIDVAVHDSIRPRFARGEALVVFSPALDRVLWANGAGARFFGNASIYDFLEEGPNRSDVTFRQIDGVADAFEGLRHLRHGQIADIGLAEPGSGDHEALRLLGAWSAEPATVLHAAEDSPI